MGVFSLWQLFVKLEILQKDLLGVLRILLRPLQRLNELGLLRPFELQTRLLRSGALCRELPQVLCWINKLVKVFPSAVFGVDFSAGYLLLASEAYPQALRCKLGEARRHI